MSLRQGTLTQQERDPRELGGTVTEAYLKLQGGSVYEFASGNKSGEAAAFLKDAGGGVYTLDSDLAEEDRKFLLIGSTLVIV
jgi:hypothetical protein